MEYYFETPVQVMFADPDNPGEWLAGIAYKNEIICGCCGGIFEISEIVEMSDGYSAHPIYPYAYWNDLSDEIVYGGLPLGLKADGCKIIELPDDFEDTFGQILDEECAEYETYYFKNLE